MSNNKLLVSLAVVACVFAGSLLSFGFYKIVVSGATKAVINNLQKSYSPSPYSPGFDPDKVNPDALRQPSKELYNATYVDQPRSFRESWEYQRSNEQ